MWKHEDGTRVVRTTEYSLPSHLHPHIEFIQPTTIFTRSKGFRASLVEEDSHEAVATPTLLRSAPTSSGAIDPNCKTKITISCLQQIYNTVGFAPKPHNGNEIAVTGYLEEFANREDLQTFYAQQRPDAVNSTFGEVLVNGRLNITLLFWTPEFIAATQGEQILKISLL